MRAFSGIILVIDTRVAFPADDGKLSTEPLKWPLTSVITRVLIRARVEALSIRVEWESWIDFSSQICG